MNAKSSLVRRCVQVGAVGLMVCAPPVVLADDSARCRENLAVLGAALQRYVVANGGKLPTRIAELHEQSLVPDLAAFSCPASGLRIVNGKYVDEHTDYEMVRQLTPQRPLLLFWERKPRHDGKALAYYSDGTSAFIGGGLPIAGNAAAPAVPGPAAAATASAPASTTLSMPLPYSPPVGAAAPAAISTPVATPPAPGATAAAPTASPTATATSTPAAPANSEAFNIRLALANAVLRAQKSGAPASSPTLANFAPGPTTPASGPALAPAVSAANPAAVPGPAAPSATALAPAPPAPAAATPSTLATSAVQLRLIPAAPLANSTFIVAYDGMPGQAQDWITLVAANAADAAFGERFFTNGARSGLLEFKGMPAGKYEVRAFFGDPASGNTIRARLPAEVKAPGFNFAAIGGMIANAAAMQGKSKGAPDGAGAAEAPLGAEAVESLRQARAHREAKRFAAARPLYEKVLQGAPTNSEALLGMGLCFIGEKEHMKAAPYFMKLLPTSSATTTATAPGATSATDSSQQTAQWAQMQQLIQQLQQVQSAR